MWARLALEGPVSVPWIIVVTPFFDRRLKRKSP